MQRTAQTGQAGSFAGLRVAITGGTSGLGLALVQETIRRGARVGFVARNTHESPAWPKSMRGPTALSATFRSRRRFIRSRLQIVGELGGLDVLINNASHLGPTPLALLGDTDCEDLEQALATNLLGPFRLTKALLGALAASARGQRRGRAQRLERRGNQCVCLFGRVWRQQGRPRHLSQIWDAELAADGVRFLSIDPGDMDTPLHALAVPDADPEAHSSVLKAQRERSPTPLKPSSHIESEIEHGPRWQPPLRRTLDDRWRPARAASAMREAVGDRWQRPYAARAASVVCRVA